MPNEQAPADNQQPTSNPPGGGSWAWVPGTGWVDRTAQHLGLPEAPAEAPPEAPADVQASAPAEAPPGAA